MRKLLLFSFLIAATLSFAQTDSFSKDQLDTISAEMKRTQQMRDSILNARAIKEQEQMEASNKRNMDYILNLQKERKAKQKKAAIIRIAIGVGFLVLLIIGLRRRRKK